MSKAPHFTERRRYIRSQFRRYNYGLRDQWSIRRIALDVAEYFGLDKPPSPGTIKTDLHRIENDEVPDEVLDEAKRLLLPDNFPEWRSTMFRAPGNKEYETPKHQLAWFHLVRALFLKEVPPDWVVEYLGITDALGGVDIREWVENPEQMLSLFLLAPPRHGKSDLAAHVIIWLICRNPDIRILWCGGKLDISVLTTKFVKNELESNEKLIEYYGPFENEGDWSETSFTVATRKTRMRSPTLRAVSKGATILSLDADGIFLDDVVDQKASESPTQVQKDMRWVKSQLMTRREPWTPMLGIGSHQPVPLGDLYQTLDNEHDNEIYFIKQRAHRYEDCKPLEDGMEEADRHGEWCMLWPSVRSWSYLEQFRKSLGDVTYEVCYNQDSRASTIEYFRGNVVRGKFPTIRKQGSLSLDYDPELDGEAGILDYGRESGVLVQKCCGRSLRTSIGFDPAASENKRAAESALVVMQACLHCRRRYIVDIWHKRQSPEKNPDTIAAYAAKYKPQRVRIEINAYQRSLSKDRMLNKVARDRRFLIDEWPTSEQKWSVVDGIPLLSRHMENGRLSVPYALPTDKEHMEPLLRELVRFPAEPNDIVMALWLADLSLQAQIDNHTMVGSEFMDNSAPDYLNDSMLVIPGMRLRE